MDIHKDSAVVLYSGGQDSTTCLAWALQKFKQVYAVVFDYGQRHRIEIEQAEKILKQLHVSYQVLSLPAFQELGNNALTDFSIPVQQSTDDTSQLPTTFVPGRNLIFLNFAAAFAYLKGIPNLVGGMCETDYSGYPDCRRDFIDSAEQSLSKAMDFSFKIFTPLMYLNKAETWLLAQKLGYLELVIQESHTCYNGDRKHFHAWGYGCGECPACLLRARGYEEAFHTA